MTTVEDENGLPAKEHYYLRCSTDHTVLIGGNSGECFRRRDGAAWAQEGLKRDAKANGETRWKPASIKIDAGRSRARA